MPLFHGPTDRTPLFHPFRRPNAPAETGRSTARYMLFLFFTTAIPEWHPYQGSTIQEAISTSQNNQFEGNRYYGDWRFIHFDQATTLSFDDWPREATQDRSALRVDSGYAPQSATPRRTPASWATCR